jgi:hypothetical protein
MRKLGNEEISKLANGQTGDLRIYLGVMHGKFVSHLFSK